MTKFSFTDSTENISSSLVEGAYYNAETRELAVDLNDDVYVYASVPPATYKALVSAPSVGRAFQNVKRTYGPSTYLGDYDGVDFVKAPSRDAVGTPKGLTLASDAKVENRFNLVSENHGVATIPAGVKFKHEVVFTLGNETERTYTVQAGSVNEALDALTEATSALGLEATAKRVVTHL